MASVRIIPSRLALFQLNQGKHTAMRVHQLPRIVGLLLAALAAQAFADDNTRVVGVVFDPGADTAEIADEITGTESVMYRFKGEQGQSLHISLRPNNQHTDFVLRAPGKWPGEEMYNSAAGGSREYRGRLHRDGFHSVTVFQNDNASHQGRTSKYDLVMTLRDVESEAKPAVSKAESDCLAAVANQVGNGDVSTIRVEMGETSTKVLVHVPGAQAPWQCNWGYRDGRPAVLEVFYKGEG